MEQIYTIPVNEAFEASAADSSCGCAFCALYNKLEENELDLILGASMMEPDVRIKTNKQGFCRTHYDMMFVRKNRLGMALTLESHINDLIADTKESALNLLSPAGAKAEKRIGRLMDDCYVCARIDFNFMHMMETAVMLWEKDDDFKKKLAAQPYVCLPHYKEFLEYGRRRFGKKQMPDFVKAVSSVVEPYFAKLSEDVSWFCKKFDYRYDEEPWYDSKDAVERAIKFLRGNIHKGTE